MYSKEDARKDIEFAIQQAENSKSSTVIIDDSFWPFSVGMTLTKCDPWWDSEGRLHTSPKYNIDWDVRNTVTGEIIKMGSLDFNDLEEGAEKLSRQIEETGAYLFIGE